MKFAVRLLLFVALPVCTTHALQAADPVAELTAYLQANDPTAAQVAEQPFAQTPLTKEQAKAAEAILWKEHVERIRRERAEEMKAKQVTVGGTTMKFDYNITGDVHADGRRLYLSMHGGGGALKRVNDSQWENQKRLY